MKHRKDSSNDLDRVPIFFIASLVLIAPAVVFIPTGLVENKSLALLVGTVCGVLGFVSFGISMRLLFGWRRRKLWRS